MILETKIQLFTKTVKGRDDVVPRFWKSKDGERAGYSPNVPKQMENKLLLKRENKQRLYGLQEY